MPHYKNGREAKPGDQVIGRDGSGNVRSGMVVSIQQSSSCNLNLVPLSHLESYLTASEFLHADDVDSAFAAPAPPQETPAPIQQLAEEGAFHP